MEKFDNDAFVDRLKELVDTKRYTMKKFSEVIEITEKTTRSVLSGASSLKPVSLYNLREKICVNVEWLLTGRGEMFLGEETVAQPKAQAEEMPVSDPISQRMKVAVDLLKKAGASPEVIQQAIMKILDSQNEPHTQAEETLSTPAFANDRDRSIKQP
ncbi:MAG: XRE family transcriptional regulator [Halodesulfovibrio sp.]|uniref:XRE family transcriptional regulator n=1 Tax=Halodesulfovibrio sp. TaxID=1912772 RepID=UPI00359DC058